MWRQYQLYRTRAGLLLACMLLLAACAGTGTAASTTNTPAATSAPATATAKPKPTGVPQITQAYCQQVMTVDEANSMMQPAIPATTIAVGSSDTGGSCNYEASKTNFVLIIYFEEWKGPVPIPQSDITAALAQAAGLPDLTVNAFTTVDGIGDQAAYLETTGTPDGQTYTIHIFYVLEGAFFFDCFTYSPISANPPGTQAQLQQCATQVDSRL